MKNSRTILAFIAISTKLVLQIISYFCSRSLSVYPDMKFKNKLGVIDLLRPLHRHARKDARSKITYLL